MYIKNVYYLIVFLQFVYNYVAWPALTSLANCRPVLAIPCTFCNLQCICEFKQKVEVDS